METLEQRTQLAFREELEKISEELTKKDLTNPDVMSEYMRNRLGIGGGLGGAAIGALSSAPYIQKRLSRGKASIVGAALGGVLGATGGHFLGKSTAEQLQNDPEALRAVARDLGVYNKKASYDLEKTAFLGLGTAASAVGRSLASGASRGVSSLAKATTPFTGPMQGGKGALMNSIKSRINRGVVGAQGALTRGYARGVNSMGADKLHKVIGGTALGATALAAGAGGASLASGGQRNVRPVRRY